MDKHEAMAREWVVVEASKIVAQGGPSLAIDSLAALLRKVERETIERCAVLADGFTFSSDNCRRDGG